MTAYRDPLASMRETVRVLRERVAQAFASLPPLARLLLSPRATERVRSLQRDAAAPLATLATLEDLTRERDDLELLVAALESAGRDGPSEPPAPIVERAAPFDLIPLIEEASQAALRQRLEAQLGAVDRSAVVARDGDYRYTATLRDGDAPMALELSLQPIQTAWDVTGREIVGYEADLWTTIVPGVADMEAHVQSRMENVAVAASALFGQRMEPELDDSAFDEKFFVHGDADVAKYVLDSSVRAALLALAADHHVTFRVTRAGRAHLRYRFTGSVSVDLAVTQARAPMPREAVAIIAATRRALS